MAAAGFAQGFHQHPRALAINECVAGGKVDLRDAFEHGLGRPREHVEFGTLIIRAECGRENQAEEETRQERFREKHKSIDCFWAHPPGLLNQSLPRSVYRNQIQRSSAMDSGLREDSTGHYGKRRSYSREIRIRSAPYSFEVCLKSIHSKGKGATFVDRNRRI